MRTIILIFLLVLSLKSYSQHNLYTFNNGNSLSEDKVKSVFDTIKKTLPGDQDLTAIIYHKAVKEDTVINYISFSVSKKTAVSKSASYNFTFQQDSTFLLLNRMLPAFKLMDLDGKEVSFKNLLGKPTLINFWAIYCGPCIAEMPWLSKLKDKYKDKMNFISITENSASGDRLHDFLKNKNFNFQVLEGGENYKRELKIGAIPKNLFIDKNGILRYIQGNYPVDENTKAFDVDDKNNYFTKIINELINSSR